ncbi:transporter substrate-binding domain-containing protein, partial [Halioglobus sp. HI00S01]
KVANREADLAICKLSMTFSRMAKVQFTKPYIKLRQSLLVNQLELLKIQRGRDPIPTIQNLEGRIGVIKKSS